MNQPRKTISIALFDLLKAAYPFTSSARTGEIPSNVPPTDQPALFLVKPEEVESEPQAYGATKYDLHYGALVYLQKDAVLGSVDHLDLLDDIMDALDNALQAPFPGSPQTLGGLVAQCSIDGPIKIVSGIVGQMCVLIVPITVVTGI
jgi:hypothetical protein